MMTETPNPILYDAATGRGYYVSAVDGAKWWGLSGPYDSHAAALADVELVRELAVRHEPRAHFYGFGTALAPSREPGICQRRSLLPLPPPYRESLEPELAAWEGEGGR